MKAGIVLLLVLAGVVPASLARIHPEAWHEYKSENFTVLTDLKPREAANRIRSLELFRAVVLKVMTAQPPSEVVPSQVFIFAHAGDFRQIIPGKPIAGFFRYGLRTNTMAEQADTPGFEQNTALYHEYVHYLLRGSRANYPHWYDEGLADMLSTIYVKDGRVIIGGEFKGRIEGLIQSPVYVPFKQVVTRDDVWNWNPYLASYFYSMSWAAVNYLYAGHLTGMPDRGKDVATYLVKLNQGVPGEKAFEDAFGITPMHMEGEINRFLQKRLRGVLAIPLDRFPHPTKVEMVRLSRKAVLYKLGNLMADGNPALARKLYGEVLDVSPHDHRAMAGIAASWRSEEKWNKALDESRAALDIKDVIPLLEYANIRVYYCLTAKDPVDCPALYDDALDRFNQALALEPDNVEAKLGAGVCLSVLGQNLNAALVSLQHAYNVMPYAPWLNYWLGHVNMQLGHNDDAIKYLKHAAYWTHDERIEALVRQDLISIDPKYGAVDDDDKPRPHKGGAASGDVR